MKTTETYPVRYSVIAEKNPREIVMLRGNGCKWKRCSFCDYHMDFSKNEKDNFLLNQKELKKVKGIYHRLEVINSGSFPDLDPQTMSEILTVCREKKIHDVHFECHWIHRNETHALRERFLRDQIHVHIKTGAETFHAEFRETVLHKGFGNATPEQIAAFADEVCLLQGLKGQDVAGMKEDIETGLALFDRVCVNIMSENSTGCKPDAEAISSFLREVYPVYQDNKRVDILLNNTDFGVGGKEG